MRNILILIMMLCLTILYSLQLKTSQWIDKKLNSIENFLEKNTINTVDWTIYK
jgi:cytochrome oxidase assembly protein ShyY1